MDKIKNFFKKNYDYYVLSTLIMVSIVTRILSYYSFTFYKNVPCFLLQQGEFIYFSTFKYINMFNVSLPNYDGIAGILFESFIGSLILLGLYFFGKRLYYESKRNWLRTLLIILFGVYVLDIISSLVITPIARCIVFGGMF